MEPEQKPEPTLEEKKKEAEEFQKQVELNENFQNEIRKEIESLPPITAKQPIKVLQDEWQESKFSASFGAISSKYSQVRRCRRDGNCFYRGFLFQMWEHFIKNKHSPEYASFLGAVEKSKSDLMAIGYDEIAIEDFYDNFLDATKKLKDVEEADAETHLMKLLNDDKEMAAYLIMYARFMTACYLKQNAPLFEGFVEFGDVAGFCTREVEAVDVECDHPQIIAITNYLGVGVEISSVGLNGQFECIKLPEEGYDGFRAKLLFVPGHYDALYE